MTEPNQEQGAAETPNQPIVSNEPAATASAPETTEPQGAQAGGNEQGGDRRNRRDGKPRGQRPNQPERPPQLTGRELLNQIDSEIESELAEAMGSVNPKALMEKSPAPTSGTANKGAAEPTSGSALERKTVRVLDVRGDHIYVDLGTKSEGVVPRSQYGDKVPKAGELVEVIVDKYDSATDTYLLRKPGAMREADWTTIEKGMVVNAIVRGANEGGLEVTVNGIRGFMPVSQIDLARVTEMGQYVGKSMRCKITELNKSSKRLVVSKKQLMLEEREELAKAAFEQLKEGEIRDGVVKKFTEFGAFVDIGGVDGLLHNSQISWQRVNKPEDYLKLNQQVKVVVLSVDKEKKKIGLGLRQLVENPWTKAAEKYTEGSLHSGIVTKLLDFGAVIDLEPGIEGLCHISEVAWRRILRVTTALKVGQRVDVKVLSFEPNNRKLSLSIKQASPEPVKASAEPAEEADDTPAEPLKLKSAGKQLKGGLGNGGPLFKR